MDLKAKTLGELQDQCAAALVIAREEGYSLALLGVLENFNERISRLELVMFDAQEAPTPRKTVSGATFQAASVTQALAEGRAAAGLEDLKATREMSLDDIIPPRRITKPGL